MPDAIIVDKNMMFLIFLYFIISFNNVKILIAHNGFYIYGGQKCYKSIFIIQ